MLLPDASIRSYELTFKPFAYKLNIEGELEINSPYKIGSKILVGKITLPNQTIDLIDIVPVQNKRCKSTVSNWCSVFRFNTFAQLSGDKYFSREFLQPEKIPIQMNFDFDSNNLDSFKSYNRYLNIPYTYQNRNQKLSEYIASLKLLQINTHLNYQNSFEVEKGYSNNIRKIYIPTQWTIHNGIQRNTYEPVEIQFPNYRYLRNTYITDWFSIKTNGNIYLQDSNEVEIDGSYIHIPSSELKKRTHGEWSSYYLNGHIRKVNNQYQYFNNYLNPGIFFDEQVNGNLNSKFKILINNHGYTITIRNPFSFKHSTKNIRRKVYIHPKKDDYFKYLENFRFIDL